MKTDRPAEPARRVSRSMTALRTVLPLVCLLLVAGCNPHDSAPVEVRVSGNIEAVDAQLGFKIPGRVVQRLVSEGQAVTAGQLIARLDDTDQQDQLALRGTDLAAAEAGLAELEAGSRPQEIAAARATLRSAAAEQERARLELERQKDLRHQEVSTVRDFEASEAASAVAQARTAEAAERLKLVEEGPRQETIAQARARVAQARAAIAIAETQISNTRLSAPFAGVVLSHNIEPGEFVSAGTPVVTVADLSNVWLRAYVHQTELGRVRHGQKAEVRTDTFPDKVYTGTVGFISSEAEFTPKTVQTTKERVKLVFRIKIDLANASDELKPGMPADAVLR